MLIHCATENIFKRQGYTCMCDRRKMCTTSCFSHSFKTDEAYFLV